MIKRFIFLFLFLPSLCFGAITEKYVSSLAGGGGTGLTAGSPLTFSEMVTAINAGTEAGSRFNVLKDGTYTRTATDTISGSGTATSPVVIRGYATTIGDGNLGRTSGNGALITTNMPLIAYNSTFKLSLTGSFILLESLNVTANVSGAAITVGSDGAVKSCKSVNASTNGSATAFTSGGNRASFLDCDAELSAGSGGLATVLVANSTNRVINNRIKGGPIGVSTVSAIIVGNVIFGQWGVGISQQSTGGTSFIYGNTIVGASGDGIDLITGTTPLQMIVENMITDNGGYGIDFNNAATGTVNAYNRYRDNTSGNINLATDWAASTSYGAVTTDTGGPETDYTASGSNDYSLISTSPAKAAGWLPYSSIGALQRQESTSGATRIPSI